MRKTTTIFYTINDVKMFDHTLSKDYDVDVVLVVVRLVVENIFWGFFLGFSSPPSQIRALIIPASFF